MSVPSPTPGEAVPAKKTVSAILVAVLLLVFVAWGWMMLELRNLDTTRCLGTASLTPGWKFILPGLAGLLVGRYSAGLRFLDRWANTTADNDTERKSAMVARIAVAIVFFALVFIFIFEAIGVYQPPNGFEPITYYVRCSIWLDNNLAGGIRTLVIIFIISLLFGHWIWAWNPGSQNRGRLRAGARGLLSDLAHKKLDALPGTEPLAE